MKRFPFSIVCLGCLVLGLCPVASAQEAATQPSVATRSAQSRPSAAVTFNAPGAGDRSSDLTTLTLEDLMNVQITSVSKARERLADAPAAATVISSEDIQRSGLQSIPELLRLAPGMDVSRVNANRWAISSRGFNDILANKLLVLFDGRTVYDQDFAGVYWDAQDYIIPDLDRIEVICGPGATMWGANAVNGVINITSKSADQTQGLLVSGLGASDQQNVGLRFGGKLDDRTYYRAYGKFNNFNNFPNSNGIGDDGWQSERGGFRIDRFSTDQDTLTLEGDAFRERAADVASLPTLAPPFTTVSHSQINSTGIDILGRWTHVIDSKSDFALQVYYDRFNRDEQVLNTGLDTFDIDFHDRFPLGERQEFTWGGGARETLIDNQASPFISTTPAYQRHYLINQFIQDDIAIVPEKLHFFIGSKFEENDLTNFEIEPSARLLWTPNDRNSIWGAISRAVRSPSVADRYGTDFVAAFPAGGGLNGISQFSGNPDFKSEQLLAYELGYRMRVNDGLSFDITGFYNQYDHLRDVQLGTPGFVATPFPHIVAPLTFANSASGPIYGGEIAANFSMNENWRLMASYSLLQSHLRSGQSDAQSQSQIAVLNGSSPVNQFQLHSYLNITKQLAFNSSGYFVERLKSDQTPSYFRLDLALTWHATSGLDLSVGVQNVLDNHHPEMLQPPTNFVTSTEMPRSYYGQLTWRY